MRAWVGVACLLAAAAFLWNRPLWTGMLLLTAYCFALVLWGPPVLRKRLASMAVFVAALSLVVFAATVPALQRFLL